MKATRKADVQRNAVFGPVLATVNVNKDAEVKTFTKDGEKIPYLTCWKSAPGGFVELFVFGDTKPGQTIPAMVELKTKMVGNREVHYLRAEACDSKPTHKLFVGSPTESGKLDPNLPSKLTNEMFVKGGEERLRVALIGFEPITAKV